MFKKVSIVWMSWDRINWEIQCLGGLKLNNDTHIKFLTDVAHL